jgi:hypothetical protein
MPSFIEIDLIFSKKQDNMTVYLADLYSEQDRAQGHALERESEA